MKKEHNRYREEETEDIKDETNEQENSEAISYEEVKAEADKYKDLYMRTLADTENFKKRMNEERIRDRKYASYELAEKLVNSLDIFDKVVNVTPEDEVLKNYLIGFQMINNQLKQILSDDGVKKMNVLGEVFNPAYHHAVETVNDKSKPDDVIIEELQSGYMYKDRVLRPALVKVNKTNKGE